MPRTSNKLLNFSKLGAFQKKVLAVVGRIPRGETKTYGQVAVLAGHPRAARAVGQALKKNPYPIIIPCHRVVGQNYLGGYSGQGGPAAKRKLLKMEKALKIEKR